jgi:hypothetical protein
MSAPATTGTTAVTSFYGVSSAEHAGPLNGGLKLERIEFLTGQGHKTEWFWFLIPVESNSDLCEKAVTRLAV